MLQEPLRGRYLKQRLDAAAEQFILLALSQELLPGR
jgi:hypothetical protein